MKLKCQFPEHVPGSLRLRFLRGARFIWLYPIVVAGILVAGGPDLFLFRLIHLLIH